MSQTSNSLAACARTDLRNGILHEYEWKCRSPPNRERVHIHEANEIIQFLCRTLRRRMSKRYRTYLPYSGDRVFSIQKNNEEDSMIPDEYTDRELWPQFKYTHVSSSFRINLTHVNCVPRMKDTRVKFHEYSNLKHRYMYLNTEKWNHTFQKTWNIEFCIRTYFIRVPDPIHDRSTPAISAVPRRRAYFSRLLYEARHSPST